MIERVARRYRRAVMLIGFHLARFAPVKNLDETGFPVAGRTMRVRGAPRRVADGIPARREALGDVREADRDSGA